MHSKEEYEKMEQGTVTEDWKDLNDSLFLEDFEDEQLLDGDDDHFKMADRFSWEAREENYV